MASTRFNRRMLLQHAVVGAAALPAMGALTSARSAAAPAAQAVELEFWTPADDPVGSKIIVDLAEGFNSTIGQEQGIHVNTRIKPVTGDNYVQYTTAMTSSGSPDVVMTYAYFPAVSWAANGFIQPLDEYAAEAGIKEEDFFPIAWNMINFADHTWGLMQEFDFYQFWWNKAIHDGEPPKTIDELDAMAKEYTTFDGDGNLTQAGFIPWIHNNGPIYSMVREWTYMWGGQWYDFDERKWTIDLPENERFLEWFLTYVDLFGGRDKSDAYEAGIPKVYGDVFQSGAVAFAQQGEWMPALLKAAEIDLDYGITQTPTAEEVPLGTAVVAGGNLFLLPTNAPHPAEAVTFIQYMGTGKSVLNWCIPNSNIPPTTADAEDPSFQEGAPELKPYLDTLALNHMVPPVQSPQLPLFDQNLPTMIDEVTYKQKTPAEALADLAAKVADGVKQFQEAHPDWEGE
jgi:multiple sugar transport system substrate-binding protein